MPREAVGERCELMHEVNLLDIDIDLGDVTPTERGGPTTLSDSEVRNNEEGSSGSIMARALDEHSGARPSGGRT